MFAFIFQHLVHSIKRRLAHRKRNTVVHRRTTYSHGLDSTYGLGDDHNDFDTIDDSHNDNMLMPLSRSMIREAVAMLLMFAAWVMFLAASLSPALLVGMQSDRVQTIGIWSTCVWRSADGSNASTDTSSWAWDYPPSASTVDEPATSSSSALTCSETVR